MRLCADVTGPDREAAVPVLVDARVIKITEGGLVLVGTEVVPRSSSSKSNVEYFPQTWWCRQLPGKMVLLPEKVRELPKWRLAFEHPPSSF